MGTNFIGLDLFSGAGGMSLGAARARIDIQLAVEADANAAATYSRNHTKPKVFAKDIRHLQSSDLPMKNGSDSVVFGGPPCQGFSTSNQRTRNSNNPSNWLFEEYLRVVNLWEPNWVVFENVTGIQETAGGLFLGSVTEALENAGYTMSVWVLNAVDYGVPQLRSRLFAIGSRDGVSVSKPRRTRKQQVTVWDAIGDLPRLTNGASIDKLPYRRDAVSSYARRMRGTRAKCGNHFVTHSAEHIIDRYKHVPQGGNWEDIPERLMGNYADRNRCHTGIYKRLRANQPSTVIGNFRKNMLTHPTQNRGLSVREAARLQSFPDWFAFQGSIGFQQQQVGNAVPPLLAEVVFRAITKG